MISPVISSKYWEKNNIDLTQSLTENKNKEIILPNSLYESFIMLTTQLAKTTHTKKGQYYF